MPHREADVLTETPPPRPNTTGLTITWEFDGAPAEELNLDLLPTKQLLWP